MRLSSYRWDISASGQAENYEMTKFGVFYKEFGKEWGILERNAKQRGMG